MFMMEGVEAGMPIGTLLKTQTGKGLPSTVRVMRWAVTGSVRSAVISPPVPWPWP